MPRKKNVLPSYLLHKMSGQARVRINGRDHLLGPFRSEESRVKYGKLISHAAGGLSVDPLAKNHNNADSGLSVAELLLAFKRHADAYYCKDGKKTAEVDCFASAMRAVRELFALIPARDFSPLNLKTVQQKYVAAGWSRGFANHSTNRIRHIWKWGVGEGLIPVATWHALQAVPPLKAGHTTAPDYKRREAVSEEHLEKVREHLGMKRGKRRDQYRDLFDLMLATGARPSELIDLTMANIDTTGEIWVADLEDHKNAHRGKVLLVSTELMEAFGGFLHRVRQPDAYQDAIPGRCQTPARLWDRWQELHSLAEQLEVCYLYDPASKDDILRALSSRPQVPVPAMLSVVADTHVEAVFLVGSDIAYGFAPICGLMCSSYDLIDRQPRFAAECEQAANGRLRDYMPNGNVASDTLTYLRRTVATEEATCEWFFNPPTTLPQHDQNKMAATWHEADATPPGEYPFGPLTGMKQELAKWILRKSDHRLLATALKRGTYWGREDVRNQCSVWFKTQPRYAEANSRRLADVT